MDKANQISSDVRMIIVCPFCEKECEHHCIEDVFTWAECVNCDNYSIHYYGNTPEFEIINFDEFEVRNRFDVEVTSIYKFVSGEFQFGWELIIQVESISPTDFENFQAYKNAIKILCVFS